MAPFKPGPDLLAGPFARKGMGPKIETASSEHKLPPAKPPRGVTVEDRIGVQAPAEVIWALVYDLEGWSDWNPTYRKAAGQVRIGEVLEVTLALEGQPQQLLKPKVLDWIPNEQLHWELRMMGGMIKTIRYIEIEALGDESCIVNNGEIFGGFMGPSLGKRIGRTLRRGFKTMNEALKERAEAAWRRQRP